MKNKNNILVCFVLSSLIFLTVSTASVLGAYTKTKVGDDPIDDILCCSDLSIIETWVEQFAEDNETWNPSDFRELFERGFAFSAIPNYIDVIEFGLLTNGTHCWIYVQVEDINGLPTCESFAFISFVFYNDTFYNEQIVFFSLYYNATWNATGGFCSAYNLDGTWHFDNIGILSNSYLLSYPCSWISEDDPDILVDQIQGMLITACLNESGDPISICLDVFPNAFWNDLIGEENFFGADNASSYSNSTNWFQDIMNNFLSFLAENWLLLLILVIIGLLIILIIVVILKGRNKEPTQKKQKRVVK